MQYKATPPSVDNSSCSEEVSDPLLSGELVGSPEVIVDVLEPLPMLSGELSEELPEILSKTAAELSVLLVRVSLDEDVFESPDISVGLLSHAVSIMTA